jgi:hypothetical protein
VVDLPATGGEGAPAKPPGLVARLKARGEAQVGRFTDWLERRRVEQIPVDLAVQYYERDRDSFASVLGAAVALRLFLFFIPVVVFVVSVVLLVAGQDGIRSITEQSGVTGSLAAQIDQSTTATRNTTIGLTLAALWLAIWAGRSLTKVLAACAAGAWGLGGREGKATLKMAASVTTLILGILVATGVLNRIKEEQGFAVVTTSWIVTAVVYSVGWFMVSLSLPRRTRDPGAMLPGAVVLGFALAGLQWVMQFYLPTRLEHSTAMSGTLGVSVAALGYMFLIGRLMVSSFILDAVIYDRVGSVSGLLFALPVLHRVPKRFPKVATFFDLERDGADAPEGTGTGPSSPPEGDEVDPPEGDQAVADEVRS